MSSLTSIPRRLPELVIRGQGDGTFVVKNGRNHRYLKIGEVEAFLLERLDGIAQPTDICQEFEARFASSLSESELNEFIELVREQELVESGESATVASPESQPVTKSRRQWWQQLRNTNPLYFRVRLFNPDRFLNWLQPRIEFVWTPAFLVFAGLAWLCACWQVGTYSGQIVSKFHGSLQFGTFAAAWLTVVAITFVHEFGHGVACKRYGGEVREIGVLFMFFTPFFFCNVSDAWLLPSRRQRLLVSLAGTYFDILTWTVAVFIWRVTVQDALVNHLAWVVLSACGARIFFNLNPLMKLDGYYALTDILGVDNLRRRSLKHLMAWLRCWLWGAPRPEPTEHGRTLLLYGAVCWLFSVAFLQLIFFGVIRWCSSYVGSAGVFVGLFVFWRLTGGLFSGISAGEFTKMVFTRFFRTALWVAAIVGIVCLPIPNRTTGTFQLRPARRVEVRAPVAGFLRELNFDEGETLREGDVIARFEIPDLDSQLARKKAEIHESEANLKRLRAGPRAEEVTEQQEKVRRASSWRDLAEQDLARARKSLEQELLRLELRITQTRSEFEYSQTIYEKATTLYQQGALAGIQLADLRKQRTFAEQEWKQAEAAKRSKEAEGVLAFEAELARRTKELADCEAVYRLLVAGTRPEEIEAEEARKARLEEELRFLEEQSREIVVVSTVSGVVATPRLKEKVNSYLEKGLPICVVEDDSELEAELKIQEQFAATLSLEEQVELKPRSQPFHTIATTVDRVAPVANVTQDSSQGTVMVYCRVDNKDGLYKSGMTGFGRVQRPSKALGLVMIDQCLRYIRTEFWW